MKNILDTLHEYTEQTPGTAILFDETTPKGYTYAQFDDMTGRVYGYLKKTSYLSICPAEYFL